MFYQPDPADGFDVAEGEVQVAKLYADLANACVPIAAEMLDAAFSQINAPAICLGWAGARDVTSMAIKALGSISSMPMAAKNFEYGEKLAVQSAVESLMSMQVPHPIASPAADGTMQCYISKGNEDARCVILRGFRDTGSNCSQKWVESVTEIGLKLGAGELAVMIDTSHGNCPKDGKGEKDPLRQLEVMCQAVEMRKAGLRQIVGVLVESNWVGGKQPFPEKGQKPIGGQSITDPCAPWEMVRETILELDAILT
jgi:3-deoxy-7-phosphoheptulonate synthase